MRISDWSSAVCSSELLASMRLCGIVTRMTEDLTNRDASLADAAAIAEIYAHYVLESTATFETEPPDVAEIRQRIGDISGAGYPFLVTQDGTGRVVAFGFGHRYGRRLGYRFSVERTIHVRPDRGGSGNGGRLHIGRAHAGTPVTKA